MAYRYRFLERDIPSYLVENLEVLAMSEEELEYVKPSYRQRGYWRKRPYTRDNPTEAQRMVRSQFIRIAHFEGTDQFGTIKVGDKVIPRSAKVIKDKMKPVTVPKPEVMTVPFIPDRELLMKIIAGEY